MFMGAFIKTQGAHVAMRGIAQSQIAALWQKSSLEALVIFAKLATVLDILSEES